MKDKLTLVPVADIIVSDDFNPRRAVALGKQFLDSVRTHGILTPILLRRRNALEGGGLVLVAGERRYRAAVEVGLEQIPALVRSEFVGDALPAALVENMHREQLSPSEEALAFHRAIAGGMKPAELAAAVGVSAAFVKGRLALLDLPDSALGLVDGGALSLKAAAQLQKFAALGPAVIAKTADLVVRHPSRAGELESDPVWMLDWTLDEIDDGAPFIVRVWEGGEVDVTKVPWPDADVAAELRAKSEALPVYDSSSYKSVRSDATRFGAADIAAARVFGCLFTLPSNRKHVSGGWVTDAAWLAEHLSARLDKAVKAWERKKSKAAKDAEPGSAAKVEAASERDRLRAEQLSARERNVSLRHSLMQLREVEPTLDVVKAIGGFLFEYAATDLGHAFRFVDEACETVKTKKSGEISSLTYSRDANHHLIVALDQADTVERALGVLVGALVAGVFVDHKAARQSDRYSHLRGLSGWSPNRAVVDAIERVAAPVLPADIKLELEQRREALAAERVASRVDYADSDLPGRVRAGGEDCPHCGNRAITMPSEEGFVVACECSDAQILDAAVSCPRCGECDCFASCSAFQAVSPSADLAEAAV